MTAEQNWLDTKHPAYAACLPQWQLNLDSYMGGVQYDEGGHLFRYSRNEGEQTYLDRKARSARRNFVKSLVDKYIAHLSKVEPTRKPGVGNDVEEFQKAPTKRPKDTISTFMAKVATYTFLMERVVVVVDQAPFAVETKAQEKELGLRPYAYLVLPQDVLDIGFDENGKLLWIKFRETVREGEGSPRTAGGLKCRYRIWTRQGWEVWEKNKHGQAHLVESGENSLGIVPAVIVDYDDGPNQWQASTPMHDICRLDRAIYNLESELDEIGCRYTFSQLWMKVGQLLANQVITANHNANKHNENAGQEALLQFGVAMGKGEVLVSTAEGDGPGAGFISPDATQGQLLLDIIEQKVKALYQLISLQDENSEAKGNPESGEKARRDFVRLDAALADFAKRLENAEWEITNLAHRWNGGTTDLPDDLAQWPDSFDVSALLDDLAESLQLDLMLTDSPTARALIRKRLVRKAFADTDEDPKLLAQIEAEIDANTTAGDTATDDDEEDGDETA